MVHARRIYARQYAALLVATAVPLAAGSLYTFGASPWPDYNPAMLEGLRREAASVSAQERTPGDGLVRAHVSVAAPGDEGGSQRDFTLHLTPVRSRGGEVVGHALLLHDVSESVELLARLERPASRDELTGLLSRRAWQDEAEHEHMRARRYGYGLGVALVDLDQLRTFNDACGQSAGDELLRAVAVACQKTLRRSTSLAAWAGTRSPCCSLI
jgi:predicted signal transduction protein with EAL and GGDEF domain